MMESNACELSLLHLFPLFVSLLVSFACCGLILYSCTYVRLGEQTRTIESRGYRSSCENEEMKKVSGMLFD